MRAILCQAASEDGHSSTAFLTLAQWIQATNMEPSREKNGKYLNACNS